MSARTVAAYNARARGRPSASAPGMPSPLESVPPALAKYGLELSDDRTRLVYGFKAEEDRSRIVALLRDLGEHGIEFKDLQTRESSLEDIFVNLVRSGG